MSAATINKPREVEGFWDLYLIRPLGYLVVLVLQRTPVTPNMVSWASLGAALLASIAYYHRDVGGAVWGLVLLILSSALDSADGQLARATGRTSELGETLDGFCDNISFTALYMAAAFSYVVETHASPLFAFGFCAFGTFAGLGHALQSSLVDFERQLFLHYCRGDQRVLREDPARLRQALDEARQRGAGPWTRALMQFRIAYCERQQRFLPSSVALLRAYRASPPSARATFADRYYAANRPLLRWWTLMATNSHKVGYVVCSFLPYLFPHVAWMRPGLALVFVYDVALNVPLVLLLQAQRRADRRLMPELSAPAPAGRESQALPA